MRGKPIPKEVHKEIRRLYCSGYPVKIIALRTEISERTVMNLASQGKWYEKLKPTVTLDDILDDYRTILGHTRGRLLEKTIENEFDEEFDRLIEKTRQLTFVTESLMKQAPYDSAKGAQVVFEKAKALIPTLSEFTPEQQVIILDGFEAVQEKMYEFVVNTIQKLT